MSHRSTMLALSLALLQFTALAANGFGGGVGVGAGVGAGGGNQGPFAAGPMVQPFEPWVKTAKVGDFVVLKYKDGKTQRKTVKAIEAGVLIGELSFDGAKAVEFKISRDEKSALPSRELDMAKSGSGSQKLGTQTVEYEVYDGFVRGLTTAMQSSITVGKNGGSVPQGNNQEAFKALKCQKVMAQAVPFGGVVKLMQAPDDGKPIHFGNGQKAGRIKNENETLELIYEVIEFGKGA